MTELESRTAATMAGARHPLWATLTMLWASVGFSVLILYGLAKLATATAGAFSFALAPHHIAALIVSVLAMAWFEGYRGFQQSFSPRFAARAAELGEGATAPQALLAPLVCMGLLWAPRRRLIGAWSLTAGIVVLVLLFRQLPQPWRGILDAGVFVGLSWGLVATWGAVAATLIERRQQRDRPVVATD
ncbi:MAG: hypothetical protein AAGA68_11835 [Pseudomonadota bacterium]